MLQGMFNLILTENAIVKEYDNELSQLVKEILSTVECDPSAALLSLQILIASMYSTSKDYVFRVTTQFLNYKALLVLQTILAIQTRNPRTTYSIPKNL
jgi:ABC-type proline/glycine betaine transport system permease subunit